MSRQSLTKAQATMTELWWELPIATVAAPFGIHATGPYRPLVECSVEVALERCWLAIKADPSVSSSTYPAPVRRITHLRGRSRRVRT